MHPNDTPAQSTPAPPLAPLAWQALPSSGAVDHGVHDTALLAGPRQPVRRQLPPLSPAAQRLVQQAAQGDADPVALARLVELDAALTIAVLRLVNSPFFGLRRQVGTVGEGIERLGLATVQRLALAAAIAQPLPQLQLRRRLMDAMWRKAMAGAVLASRLLDGHAASPMAFTAGVLQDIGRLELHLRSPDDYAAMESLSGSVLCAAERACFGQTHAAAGAELAEAWGLPPTVVEAIARHHARPELVPASPAGQAVWLASLIGDADLGTLALPPLVHLKADPAQALAASQRESEALCVLVGA